MISKDDFKALQADGTIPQALDADRMLVAPAKIEGAEADPDHFAQALGSGRPAREGE